MDNDTLHRIEHKLDELLEYFRKRDEIVPKMPTDPRLCPVCTNEVQYVPTVFVNQKGEIQTGISKRLCGCKIYPTLRQGL